MRAARLGLGVALVASACATLPTPFELPRHNIPGQGASAVATGGTIRFDGRCIWLDDEGGGSANLLWPASYAATAPTLEIRGTSGKVIIREGDVVELGVSESHVSVPGCPVRAVWLVGEVSKVGDVSWPDGAPAQPARTTAPYVK